MPQNTPLTTVFVHGFLDDAAVWTPVLHQRAMLDEVRSALPYSALSDELFDRVLDARATMLLTPEPGLAPLPTTDAAVWSLYPGEISSPTVTPGPDEEVYAPETESPVLVCMEQTGQSRLDCHDDILQSNTGGQPTDAPAPTSASGAS